MGLGTGIGFVRVVLYFGLVLLALGLMTFRFISAASPEFVIIVMAIGISGVTVIAAWIYLWVASKKEDK